MKYPASIGYLFSNVFEKNVIDGIVNGLGSTTVYLSSQLRKIQTGNIGFYVFAMVAGIILMLLFGLAKMNFARIGSAAIFAHGNKKY